MRRTTIDPDMPVDDIMRRWPATIRLFLQRGMLCIGCPIGVFHTVMDACNAHSINPETFAAELDAALLGHPFPDARPSESAPNAGRGPSTGGRCRG